MYCGSSDSPAPDAVFVGRRRPRRFGIYGTAMLDKLVFGESPLAVALPALWQMRMLQGHLCRVARHRPSTYVVWHFITGLGGATLVTATLPFHAQKAGVLLLAVGLLGIFCGVAFGSSYALVSRFTARESVALTTGAFVHLAHTGTTVMHNMLTI